MTNGILVNYTVLQRGVVIAVTLPSALDYNVTGLLPFSSYNFSIMTCTAEGCVESPSLMASTLEDGKYQEFKGGEGDSPFFFFFFS